MSALKPFNVNNYVRVRLTETGWDILRSEMEQRKIQFPNAKWSLPEPDADGWIRYQMRAFMQEFGQHISMGMMSPFETEIMIEFPAPPEAT